MNRIIVTSDKYLGTVNDAWGSSLQLPPQSDNVYVISGKFRAFAAHRSVPMLALSLQLVGSGLDFLTAHIYLKKRTKLATFMHFFSPRSLLSIKYDSKYQISVLCHYIYIYVYDISSTGGP